MTSPEIRVPVGVDAHRWVTVATERTVLVVARTLTSTVRALDAVRAFEGDPRVQVVFAADPGSAFASDVPDLLRHVGARVVPWQQLPEERFDAVITASENADLRGINAPILVLPHGVGFHKYVPDSRGPGRRLAGSLRPDEIVGRNVLITLSHPSQAEQLRQHDPNASSRTVVVAEPVLERLRASILLRDRYRDTLGTAGRRLVVVSSTWGRQSLLGRWPDAPIRLLGELPADEYHVAVVLHPNVWSGHGAWQVRSWLARAREAGLILIPPERGWQAALVASDCVVADHGSVSLYAAGLDRPLLLAPFSDEVVPDTSLAMLGRFAPQLEPGQPWSDQVATTIATHRPGQYDEIAERTFAGPPLARALRSVLYELLELTEPPWEMPLDAWPEPEVEQPPVTSYAIYTRQPTAGEIQALRIPAAAYPAARHQRGEWLRHLAADDRERNLSLVESAAVVVREEPNSAPDSAVAWARRTLTRLPGAQLAASATPYGSVVVLRSGGCVEVRVHDGDPCAVMLQAACVYALMQANALADSPVRLKVGDAVRTLNVVVRP